MRRLFNIILKPFIFLVGIILYPLNKKNYEIVYQSYIVVYCISSGFISLLLSKIIKIFSSNKSQTFNPQTQNVSQYIDEYGYKVLNEEYDNLKVDNLFDLTNRLKCTSKNDSSSSKFFFKDQDNKFPTYSYSENELLCEKSVLDTVVDNQFVEIARSYFECPPILTSVNMWWSTDYLKKANEDAAQMFHFDLDRIKWLKIFIYLTDVGENNGPHVYIEKTHKPFSKPYKFMTRGYQRISDEEIYSSYPKNRIKTLLGKRGTVIIGDTSCYHKGLAPISGNRLIFEFELSNSLFGGLFNNNTLVLRQNKNFLSYKKKYPNLFQRY